jgi:carbonic anhydrase
VPPDDALLLLRDGNRRFVAGEAVHFQQDALRRSDTANNGQKPFAVILTCSDSRVPPELIFDQGIGCLFVIRVAGNVARTDEVATVEYGVGHLGARLVVVLGHTRCGAVTAVVEEAHVGPNLAQLVEPIGPAVTRARHENPGKRGAPLVDAAIHANVEQAMGDLLRQSSELSLAVAHGQARVVGALYDLESGEVKVLESKVVPPPAADFDFAPKPPAEHPPSGHH